MSQTVVFVICAPGTKWTAPLSFSTPDPCPTGQAFKSASMLMFDQTELTRIDQTEQRIAALEASASSVTTMPSSTEISLAFGTAFSTVLLCFLVARGVGTVLNFIRHG